MRLNRATLLLYGFILAVLSWKVAAPFWGYLVLGLLVASVSWPLQKRLRRKLKRERVAALLTLAIILVAIILPVTFLTWQIVEDMRSLVAGLSVQQVAAQVETLAVWSHNTFGYPADLDQTGSEEIIREIVPEVRSRLAQWLPGAITTLGTFLLGLFVMILTAYYALIQGEGFVERLKAASPMDDRMETQFLREAKQTVDGVLMGQLVTALLQGGLGFVAFIVAGIPNPFFWTFVMAILSFLPLVGAFLVWMPAAIYLFAIGDTVMGVGMILWGVLVISSVDNIVKPIVIGKRGQLHPLLAFIGVLGGLIAFGFMGFVIGPLVLSLFAAVFNVLAETGWEPNQALSEQDGAVDEGLDAMRGTPGGSGGDAAEDAGDDTG